MSRSNKEARPNQPVDGGGQVNWTANMGKGQAVKPKEAKDGGVSGIDSARKRQGQPKKDTGAAKPASTEGIQSSGKTGWAQVGESGAAMVKHYNTNKKSTGSVGGA